jgi:methionine--tRNA ligase beta chain
MATLDDFKKLDLRVAEILDVEPHPNADRLYVLKLKVGDRQKQIVAGIKEFYSADELKGKRIAIIDNLEPVVLRGVESQGMLLAAKDENGLGVLTVERPVDSGSSIG